MKKFLLMLCLMIASMTKTAMATSIDIETDVHSFKAFTTFIQGDVASIENKLNVYLVEKLDCSLVQLDLKVLKESKLFSAGKYYLHLTAECNNQFTDFNLTPIYGDDYGNPYEVKLDFVVNGRSVEQTITSTFDWGD